ncbi:MAG: hypothetical protein L0Y58_19575 [Verrucomicrobia subdivision 3 bacterium]|nr:hypothetical protein [Limisphaerales bacterium]
MIKATERCVKQFRIYLKSELSKLGNQGNGCWFLGCVSSEVLNLCGVPANLDDLVEAFHSQERVNTFVDSLADTKLELLTKTCDQEWRKNGIYDELKNHSDWREERVAIGSVDVRQAEPELPIAAIFKRNAFQLTRIADDPELWTHKPYAEWDLNAPVFFPIFLGRYKSGRWKLFDGIHRAIHLARRGEDTITVYFYKV